MTDSRYNILFICTGNSARSIMAEALMNDHGGSRFLAYSAGSQPKGAVHPMALKTLQHLKIPTTGLRSKSWGAFADPSAPSMDFVITVCDQAAGEVCPVWPGQPITAHWGMPDPALADGSAEDVARIFLDAAHTLKRRIEFLLSLPLQKLERLSIQSEVRAIGAQVQ